MTDRQVGALHDLAVSFGPCEIDVTEEPHRSIVATIYTTGRAEVAVFSVSETGVVRSRERVAA